MHQMSELSLQISHFFIPYKCRHHLRKEKVSAHGHFLAVLYFSEYPLHEKSSLIISWYSIPPNAHFVRVRRKSDWNLKKYHIFCKKQNQTLHKMVHILTLFRFFPFRLCLINLHRRIFMSYAYDIKCIGLFYRSYS